MFERMFIDALEADGMQVVGEFRDEDEPDHFVWLRGFPTDSPEERAAALDRFYGGPVWAKHREAANATMIDSDDVLLLRPLTPFRPGRRGPVAVTLALLDSPPPPLAGLDRRRPDRRARHRRRAQSLPAAAGPGRARGGVAAGGRGARAGAR